MTDNDFPSRWSELKSEWKRKKASLRSSRGWSTVESKCRLVSLFPACLFVQFAHSLFSFSGMMRKRQQTIRFRAAPFYTWCLLWEEDTRNATLSRPCSHDLGAAMSPPENIQPGGAVSLVWVRTFFALEVDRVPFVAGTFQRWNLQMRLLWSEQK